MTIIDNSDKGPPPFECFLFVTLAVLFLICAFFIYRRARAYSHYHSIQSVRYLFPVVCIIDTIVTLSLAASQRIIAHNNGNSPGIKIIYALQACKVPILLLVTFELTYLIHKKRSVNFCGMKFDRGKRTRNLALVSFAARHFIRALALGCLILGLFSNLTTKNPLVGRVGWTGFQYVASPWTPKDTHLLLSLIPTFVLFACCLYLSLILWRYGTESSMVIHSSYLNPWFYPFFGTLAYGFGHLFSEKYYSFSSILGEFLLIISLYLLMKEIDKDMIATASFSRFLNHVVKSRGLTDKERENLQITTGGE